MRTTKRDDTAASEAETGAYGPQDSRGNPAHGAWDRAAQERDVRRNLLARLVTLGRFGA